MTPTGTPGPNSRGGRRGRSDDDPLSITESLASVSARLGVGSPASVTVIFGHWDEIVGPAVAAHVHPLRIEGTTLLVGADHPAWVTQVRHLAPHILERMSEACADGEAPERIDVRVIG